MNACEEAPVKRSSRGSWFVAATIAVVSAACAQSGQMGPKGEDPADDGNGGRGGGGAGHGGRGGLAGSGGSAGSAPSGGAAGSAGSAGGGAAGAARVDAGSDASTTTVTKPDARPTLAATDAGVNGESREGEGDVFQAGPYPLHPDLRVQPGVPRGELIVGSFQSPGIYKTERPYVYVVYKPVQYDATKPAALMMFQDQWDFAREGGEVDTRTVFDNLIAQKKLPVTIVVFHAPHGVTRNAEYDAVNDRYARFLIDELLPEIKKTYNISDDPRLHAIGGHSAGGEAAFGVAWFRPDYFPRVLTANAGLIPYGPIVRSSPAKPMRVFMQTGEKDIVGPFNVIQGNKDMAAALKAKGYHYRFVWGTLGHDYTHIKAILPDALIWLWQGWQQFM